MFLPTKHIRISESLIGLVRIIVKVLTEPMTIDRLWIKYSKYNDKRFPAYHNFDNLVLSVNLLYIMGIVNINDKGELYYATD